MQVPQPPRLAAVMLLAPRPVVVMLLAVPLVTRFEAAQQVAPADAQKEAAQAAATGRQTNFFRGR